MTVNELEDLLNGEKVQYKNGFVFIDKGEDYGESFKKGFMSWIHGVKGSHDLPLSIRENLEDALRDIDNN